MPSAKLKWGGTGMDRSGAAWFEYLSCRVSFVADTLSKTDNFLAGTLLPDSFSIEHHSIMSGSSFFTKREETYLPSKGKKHCITWDNGRHRSKTVSFLTVLFGELCSFVYFLVCLSAFR